MIEMNALKSYYCDRGLSFHQCYMEMGVSPTVIERWVDEYGLIRGEERGTRNEIYIDPEEARAAYLKCGTAALALKELGFKSETKKRRAVLKDALLKSGLVRKGRKFIDPVGVVKAGAPSKRKYLAPGSLKSPEKTEEKLKNDLAISGIQSRIDRTPVYCYG